MTTDPDHPLPAGVAEVAQGRILDHLLEISPVIPLRENAVAQRPSIEAALHSLGDFENYLCVRFHNPLRQSP